MKIAVGIETSDRTARGGRNYLLDTLENFQRAGGFGSPLLHSVHVACDDAHGHPDLSDALARHPITVYRPIKERKWSRMKNAAVAIQQATATGADLVIKLEDDLDFCASFLESVALWAWEHRHYDVPMIVLGASFETVSDSRYAEGESITGPGESFPKARAMMADGVTINHIPVKGFWGAQAIAFRRDPARHLSHWLGDDPYLVEGAKRVRTHGHDLLLQVWGQRLGAINFGAPVPSFVQHIGRKGGLNAREGKDRFHEFPWPGREWRYELGQGHRVREGTPEAVPTVGAV